MFFNLTLITSCLCLNLPMSSHFTQTNKFSSWLPKTAYLPPRLTCSSPHSLPSSLHPHNNLPAVDSTKPGPCVNILPSKFCMPYPLVHSGLPMLPSQGVLRYPLYLNSTAPHYSILSLLYFLHCTDCVRCSTTYLPMHLLTLLWRVNSTTAMFLRYIPGGQEKWPGTG